jgi:hypothetical protein
MVAPIPHCDKVTCVHRRPLSVTIIGWLLLIFGVMRSLRTLSALLVLSNDSSNEELFSVRPLPIPTQLVIYALGTGISLLAGAYILRGANWARMLWTIWCIFLVILSLFISPDKNLFLPGLIFQFLIIFFLFLPGANDYFGQTVN